jgi:hypothetical protein
MRTIVARAVRDRASPATGFTDIIGNTAKLKIRRPAMGITGHDEHIVRRQIALLYQNLRTGQLISLGNATFLALVNQVYLDFRLVAIWWVAACLAAFFRLAQNRRYQQQAPAPADPRYWLRQARIGVALSGLAWGAGAFYMIGQAHDSLQFFNAFIMSGMVAGAVPILAADSFAFRSYALPIVAAVGIAIAGPQLLHLAAAFMALVFLLASYLAGPVLKGKTGEAAARANYAAYKALISKAAARTANQSNHKREYVPQGLAARGVAFARNRRTGY